MTTSRVKASLSHIERTAFEPRDDGLHTVHLTRIEEVTSRVRLLRLSIPPDRPIKFLPGQWLDVYAPGISKAGGFTLTSTPAEAKPVISQDKLSTRGYLELAVQDSPNNPPAAWLWRPQSEILNQELNVRVGGSFTWPHHPPSIHISKVRRLVFIAGGVGINPLMSMMSHLAQIKDLPYDVRFLYSTKATGSSDSAAAGQILFLDRLSKIFHAGNLKGDLKLYMTPQDGVAAQDGTIATKFGKVDVRRRRITENDIEEALGPEGTRASTICYICGVPTMTDRFVDVAQNASGMNKDNVLFEKWW